MRDPSHSLRSPDPGTRTGQTKGQDETRCGCSRSPTQRLASCAMRLSTEVTRLRCLPNPPLPWPRRNARRPLAESRSLAAQSPFGGSGWLPSRAKLPWLKLDAPAFSDHSAHRAPRSFEPQLVSPDTRSSGMANGFAISFGHDGSVGQGQVEHQSRSAVQPARSPRSLCYVSLGSTTASPAASAARLARRFAATHPSSTHRSRRPCCDYAFAAPRARAHCVRVASSIAGFRPRTPVAPFGRYQPAPFWSRLRRRPGRVIISSSPSWLTLINALAHARS